MSGQRERNALIRAVKAGEAFLQSLEEIVGPAVFAGEWTEKAEYLEALDAVKEIAGIEEAR